MLRTQTSTRDVRPLLLASEMIPSTLFDRTQTSLLISNLADTDSAWVVVGAPHHAPAGVRCLKCNRPADQNTGLIAWEVAHALGAPFVIATNAEVDPNKSLTSKYSAAVRGFGPRFLLEIHGHGMRNVNFDVEVSAGSVGRSEYAVNFATALSNAMRADPELSALSVSGDFRSIRFRATRTATMHSTDWIGIHVELPLLVRKQGSGSHLPNSGSRLATCLASAMLQLEGRPV